jgi:hypothetical protein
VGVRKAIAVDVSKHPRLTPKLGRGVGSRMSLAGARRLARRCPAWR